MLWAAIAVLTIVLVIISFLFGGWVFLILLAPAVIAFFSWIVWGGSSRRRSGRITRDKPELLGPGGPDDPDRAGRTGDASRVSR